MRDQVHLFRLKDFMASTDGAELINYFNSKINDISEALTEKVLHVSTKEDLEEFSYTLQRERGKIKAFEEIIAELDPEIIQQEIDAIGRRNSAIL